MRIALAAAALLFLGACRLKGGPGKLDAEPAWKVYVREHPLWEGPGTFRRSGVELRLERVVLEEHYTAVSTHYWLAIAKVVVVNRGDAPFPATDVVGSFSMDLRSGKACRATGFVDGSRKGGWALQEFTKLPTALPPGAEGRVRVQCEVGTKNHDDPVAVKYLDQRVELR